MNNRKTLVGFISLVASLIAIFTFVTGIQSLSELGRGNDGSNINTENETINDGVIVDDRFLTSTVIM